MKSLLITAAQLQRFFLEQQWRFCFIGGIALQRWGEPRLTVDIDVSLLTGLGSEQLYVDALCRQYEPRIPDARQFALEHRVLLLQSGDRIPLDIALAAFPYEELVIQRATGFEFVAGTPLRTCSAEDLVILKAFADRARDWADIEGILVRQGSTMDRGYIAQHLPALCELKQNPDIIDKLNRMYTHLDQLDGA